MPASASPEDVWPTPPASDVFERSTELAVVVATHNRLAFLTGCLAALVHQAQAHGVQVVVVDSCSDTNTAIQVQALAAMYNCTFLRIDQPGVAKARNAGVALTQSAWFATLDDDALPDPHWLEGALKALRSAQPGVGLIQGRVEPWWLEGEPPTHLEPRHSRFLSIVAHERDHDITGAAHCAGANMLVRRRAYDTIGGYGETFGRVGNNLASGIDTDLVEKMRVEALRITYSNAFAVRHAVPANRLTPAWIRERSLQEGRAGGKIIFARRALSVQLLTVAKSLAALPVLSLMSRIRPDSMDLVIRRNVNWGILENAPIFGRRVRFSNSRQKPLPGSPLNTR